MLILPAGHASAVRQPRALRPREKWMIGGVGVLVAALVATIVISFAAGGASTRRGCISVALAYSTGGAQIDRCGAGARALCAGVGHAGGITGAPARPVARACRKAGLPVG